MLPCFKTVKVKVKAAMKIALAALKGEKVDPITMIPYVLVTPENIKDYVE